jgi:lysophospholipase L1-like esterase
MKLTSPLLKSKGSGYFVFDDFIDVDDTSIIDHYIKPINVLNTGWKIWGGAQSNAKIASNKVKNSVASMYASMCVDTGLTDCLVGVTYVHHTTTEYEVTGLVIRLVDKDNYWQLYIFSNGGSPQLIMRYYEAGTGHQVAGPAALTLTNGVSYPFTFEAKGNVLTGTIAGVSITYTSAKFNTGTRQGFGFYENDTLDNVSSLDNFWVKNKVSTRLPTRGIFAIGDSKTEAAQDYYDGYPVPMLESLKTETPPEYWIERPTRHGLYGGTIAELIASINAGSLDALQLTPAPDYILINLGVNDCANLVTEANYKSDYGACLVWLHARFPSAQIGLMRIGNRWNLPAEQDHYDIMQLMDGTWIPAIIAAHPGYTFLGPDERVFLEGGDNYVTYTVDGCHPNHAGYALTATNWLTSMGY